MSRTLAELLGGIAVPVDTNGFANDLVMFRDRNDVLTLLSHLGYLAYESESKSAYIPNEEIHEEETVILFYNNEQALRSVIKMESIGGWLNQSDQEETVSGIIERVWRSDSVSRNWV